ncbi:hypothetical protein ACQEWB_19915 [Streptomyces sp. CA-249302]|uniref:hypothetical protein n=1 Tax=Streptomyces sp. CA-249302 TaxID=3240058 RepID=UPI003D89E91E
MTVLRTAEPPRLPIRNKVAAAERGWGGVSPMLTRLAAERATGVLMRERGTLYLADGQVILAESPLATGLDALLTARGVLTAQVWQEALTAAGDRHGAGRQLVDAGRLALGALELCHLTALYDAAYFVLAPSSTPGRFRYGSAPGPGVLTPVPVAALERETLRRRDLLHRIWPNPATDDAPLTRTDLPAPPALTRRQQQVLAQVDGARTATDIARELGHLTFHTLVDIRRLAAAGVVAPLLPTHAEPSAAPARREPTDLTAHGTPTDLTGHGTPTALTGRGESATVPTREGPADPATHTAPTGLPGNGEPAAAPAHSHPAAAPAKGRPVGATSHATPAATPAHSQPGATPAKGRPAAAASHAAPADTPAKGLPAGAASHAAPVDAPPHSQSAGVPTHSQPVGAPANGQPPGAPGHKAPAGSPSRGAPADTPAHGQPGLPTRGEPGLPTRGEPGLPTRGQPGLPTRGEPPDGRPRPSPPGRGQPFRAAERVGMVAAPAPALAPGEEPSAPAAEIPPDSDPHITLLKRLRDALEAL